MPNAFSFPPNRADFQLISLLNNIKKQSRRNPHHLKVTMADGKVQTIKFAKAIIAAGSFLIWLLVITADISSTYIGVTTVQPESWPLTVWLAATVWAAGTWSAFLTFVPELLIIGGVRWLARGRF